MIPVVVCRFLHGYHLATIRWADLVLLWPLYYTLPYDDTDTCVLYKWVRNVRCYNKQLFIFCVNFSVVVTWPAKQWKRSLGLTG